MPPNRDGATTASELVVDSPERARREELHLASDHRVRSEIIARPITLSTTDPSMGPPFGGCEAALFPALTGTLASTLTRPMPARNDLVLASLVPLLNGVIELSESGYRLQPLRLDDLACDESGRVIIVDAGRVTGRCADRSIAAETGDADGAGSTSQEALSILAPVVEQLSDWHDRSSGQARPGATVAHRWASWCDQIEGASARATLTLLEAQLVAWHAEEVRAARATHPAYPARDTHPMHDEAAPTEVDAA